MGTVVPGQAVGGERTGGTDLVTLSLTRPGTPDQVSIARRWVRLIFEKVSRADDVELIVTELVTNAIRHTASGRSGGTFNLTVRRRGRWSRVEVRDQGGWRLPGRRDSPADRVAPENGLTEPDGGLPETGRGLMIVRAVADRYGRRSTAGGGQLVWAEVSW
jgi:anti-sigma regulatory factor (Ser/Thr protein kinase)